MTISIIGSRDHAVNRILAILHTGKIEHTYNVNDHANKNMQMSH